MDDQKTQEFDLAEFLHLARLLSEDNPRLLEATLRELLDRPPEGTLASGLVKDLTIDEKGNIVEFLAELPVMVRRADGWEDLSTGEAVEQPVLYWKRLGEICSE